MADSIVSQERLRELLDYNSTTGVFTWRVRNSARINVGDAAGSRTGPCKYVRVNVDGRMYYAHRLAILYTEGAMPAAQVDHINGDRADNRLSNLRCVTQRQNSQNLRAALSNNLSSGLLGVSWDRRLQKWNAYIKLDRKRRHIGYFETAEAAHAAYIAEKRKLHPFGML